MTIKITSLQHAYSQLKTSMQYYHSESAANDKGLKQQFRNSVIQCFECTYELAYKMIRRQLIEISQTPGTIKEMNFADLIRTAAEAGLLSDVKRFLEYREMRNLTSHTYDENKALEIMKNMDHFAADINTLILELEKRNS